MSRTKKALEDLTQATELQDAIFNWIKPDEEDLIPITSIYKALSDFQQEMPIMGQNAQGYGYRYVDLAEITRIVVPLLRKHGLGYTQPLCDDGAIKTILFHYPTGQTIESKVQMPMNVQLEGMNDFQVYGNAISYFRRYSLSSILGIVSDKDLDASGEQLKPENPNTNSGRPWAKDFKKGLNENDFNIALDMIKTGQYSKEKLIAKYKLTEEQLKTLEK